MASSGRAWRRKCRVSSCEVPARSHQADQRDAQKNYAREAEAEASMAGYSWRLRGGHGRILCPVTYSPGGRGIKFR